MNSSYEVLNFIIELKNDYEVKKVLIETKIQELNNELEKLLRKKQDIEEMDLEPSSVFSPYCNSSKELNQIQELIQIKKNELTNMEDSKSENQNKQAQLQHLRKILSEMVDQEYEIKEWKSKREVHKDNQILAALNFNKHMNHSIALQLKSISGDLDSLSRAAHSTKLKKKSANLLKRDIKMIDEISDYLYAGTTDTVGIIEAINHLIQQKTKDSTVHIIFTYDEKIEDGDVTKKYFVKQIIEYLYSIFEIINHLSKVEIKLEYVLEQYHLTINIDRYSSEVIETYPLVDYLVQVYDGTFSIESNEYFTQFHIIL